MVLRVEPEPLVRKVPRDIRAQGDQVATQDLLAILDQVVLRDLLDLKVL